MKLQAPLTVEIVGLNDWRYWSWSGLGAWQVVLLHVEVGWPPMLIVKVAGIGFRVDVTWGE